MGSWLFLGFPAVVLVGGMFELWTAIGLIAGMWAAWTFIAPRLREKTANLNALTLSTFFADAFQDTSGVIQLISTSFALLFFTFYIASGLVGLSLVFSSAFGMSYHVGIVVSVITAALYTLVGGFVAVAWCDFFQGLFLLAMILLVPFFGYQAVGGWDAIAQAAALQNISLSIMSSPQEMLSALFLAASWGLGYFGQPHILVNFMGIDDVRNIKYARAVGIAWQTMVLLAACAVGIVGISFFAGQLSNPQLVFIDMTLALFHPFVAGLILCAIFAATLSTMDSLILVAGSMCAEDLYKQFIDRSANAEKILWISRVGSIAIASAALALAWNSDASVYDLVNYAWSGLGSTFGPLVIASLYFKGVTKGGAVAGILVGGATAALWPFYFGSLPLVPGFFAGIAVLFIGSKMR
jgi:sodium/proline symporter